jgi:hypothetical protein
MTALLGVNPTHRGRILGKGFLKQYNLTFLISAKVATPAPTTTMSINAT